MANISLNINTDRMDYTSLRELTGALMALEDSQLEADGTGKAIIFPLSIAGEDQVVNKSGDVVAEWKFDK